MYQFLRNYCTTPHSTTVVAPAVWKIRAMKKMSARVISETIE